MKVKELINFLLDCSMRASVTIQQELDYNLNLVADPVFSGNDRVEIGFEVPKSIGFFPKLSREDVMRENTRMTGKLADVLKEDCIPFEKVKEKGLYVIYSPNKAEKECAVTVNDEFTRDGNLFFLVRCGRKCYFSDDQKGVASLLKTFHEVALKEDLSRAVSGEEGCIDVGDGYISKKEAVAICEQCLGFVQADSKVKSEALDIIRIAIKHAASAAGAEKENKRKGEQK